MDIYFRFISKYPWFIATYLQYIVQKYENADGLLSNNAGYLKQSWKWGTGECRVHTYCMYSVLIQTLFLLERLPGNIHITMLCSFSLGRLSKKNYTNIYTFIEGIGQLSNEINLYQNMVHE